MVLSFFPSVQLILETCLLYYKREKKHFKESRGLSRIAFCQSRGSSDVMGRQHEHVATPAPVPDHIASLLAPRSRFIPSIHPQPHMIHRAHQPPLCWEAVHGPGNSYTIAPLASGARPAFPPPLRDV